MVIYTLLAVVLASSAVPATPTPEQVAIEARQSIDSFWEARIKMGMWSGFGSLASVDGELPQLSGDESGAVADAPTWCFQGGTGMSTATLLFIDAYEKFGQEKDWQRASSLGRTLISTQLWNAGGWSQDGAVIGNKFEPVGVWGGWGNRVHVIDTMRGAMTLDDGTSTSCATALLRLHEAAVRRSERRQEPMLISTEWLDGAKLFADQILNLDKDGIPQVIPIDKALIQRHNQNADTRSPSGVGYMSGATLNDNASAHVVAFLMECSRITGDDKYKIRAEKLIRWIISRPNNDYPGWCQQYDWNSGLPRWGREMEPPFICTCESDVVSALLWWRLNHATPNDRIAIEEVLTRYLLWLERVERPIDPNTGLPDTRKVWRYYASATSGPGFAKAFTTQIGSQYESWAKGGQPYRGEWDNIWLLRLRPANSQVGSALNFNLSPRYVSAFPEGALPRKAFPSSRLGELISTKDPVSKLWPYTQNIAGRNRKIIDIGATTGRIRCLINAAAGT